MLQLAPHSGRQNMVSATVLRTYLIYLFISVATADDSTCRQTTAGTQYIGTLNVTASNRPCQQWNSQTPHRHSYKENEYFPDGSVADASNFCRNPGDGKPSRYMPWCYVDIRSNWAPSWEYCGVPVCGINVCDAALGMESGAINDSQITSSGQYSSAYPTKNARLNHPTGWVGRGVDSFLRVDLLKVHKISKISIQDAGSDRYYYRRYYTKQFRVLASLDGLRWEVRKNTDGSQKLFEGIRERFQKITIQLPQPLTTRYIVIKPASYYSRPALRMELYGCIVPQPAPTVSTTVNDDILIDTIWDLPRSPFLINKPITVSIAAKLRIQAGVEVIMMNSNAKLIVAGCLTVEGTENLKVSFMSSSFFGKLKTNGYWSGIEIKSSACSVAMNHVTISGAQTGVATTGSSLSLRNVHIHHCSLGISMNSPVTSALELSDSVVENIANNGLIVISGGNITVSNTKVRSCDYGVNFQKRSNGASIFQITGSTISYCTNYGIYIGYSRDVKIMLRDTVLHKNRYGLQVSNYESSTRFSVYFSGVRITSSQYYGVYINLGRYMTGEVVFDNSEVSSSREGITLTLYTLFFGMKNSYLGQNSNFGLKVHSSSSKVQMTNNTIARNKDPITIGNINADVLIDGNLFTKNHGSRVINLNNKISSLKVTNNTFVNNTATETLQYSANSGSGPTEIRRNIFSNPSAKTEVGLYSSWTFKRAIDVTFNYWGSDRVSHIWSRVVDFFRVCQASEALISPALASDDITNADLIEMNGTMNASAILSGGRLSSDQNVTVDNTTYHLTRTLHVTKGTNLYVKGLSSALVKVKESICVLVEGSIHFEGISLEPLTPGKRWSGIVFHGASDSTIKGCTINGASHGARLADGPKVLITDTTIKDNSIDGVRFDISKGGLLKIDKSNLINNQQIGIKITGKSRLSPGVLTLSNSHVDSNLDGLYWDAISGIHLTVSQSTFHYNSRYQVYSRSTEGSSVEFQSTSLKGRAQRFTFYFDFVGSVDQNMTIANCSFHHTGRYSYAIYLYSRMSTTRGVTMVMSRSSIVSTTPGNYDAVYIYSSDRAKVKLKGNHVTSPAQRGIRVHAYRPEHIDIEGNVFTTCKEALKVQVYYKNYIRHNSIQIVRNSFLNGRGSPQVTLQWPRGFLFSVPVKHNRFINNTGDTVLYVQDGRTALVTDNHFDNPDASFNVRVNHGYLDNKVLHAEGNWWGTSEYVNVLSKIYDHSIQPSLLKVSFLPYVTSPNTKDLGSSSVPFFMGDRRIGGVLPDDYMLNSEDGKPFYIVQDILIPRGKTLTIAPGSDLVFGKAAGITVEGRLISKGTSEKKITMRPENDNSDWNGIVFRHNRADLIRLTGGSSENNGIVEFHAKGRWVSVCNDYYWDNRDAAVFCRQIGYDGGVETIVKDNRFGNSNISERVYLSCNGNEKIVQECHYHARQRCNQAAGVVCKVNEQQSISDILYLESKAEAPLRLSYKDNMDVILDGTGKRFWVETPSLTGTENTVSLQSFESPGWYLFEQTDGTLSLDYVENPVSKLFRQLATFSMGYDDTDKRYVYFQSTVNTSLVIYVNASESVYLSFKRNDPQFLNASLFRMDKIKNNIRKRRALDTERGSSDSGGVNALNDTSRERPSLKMSVLEHTTVSNTRQGVQIIGVPPSLNHVQILKSSSVGIQIRGYRDYPFQITNSIINDTSSTGILISSSSLSPPGTISISDVIVGYSKVNSGLRFTDSQDLVVTNSTFVGHGHVSVYINRDTIPAVGSRIVFEECKFFSNRQGAMLIHGSGNVTVHKSTFRGNFKNTVSLYEDSGVNYVISGCKFEGNRYSRYYGDYVMSISGYRAQTRFRIVGNTMEYNDLGSVIRIDGSSSKIDISKNVIRNNVIRYESAVSFTNNYGVTFRSNQMYNPKARYEMELPRYQEGQEIDLTGNFWGVNTSDLILPRIKGFFIDMSKSVFNIWPFKSAPSDGEDDLVYDDDYFFNNGFGGDIKSASITINSTDGPYVVTRSIYVRENGGLIIEEGTHLRFSAGRGILSRGKFEMRSGQAGIRLTSSSNSRWNGLIIFSGNNMNKNKTEDPITISNIHVEHASNGLDLKGSVIAVRNVTFSSISDRCLTFSRPGTATLSDSNFSDCGNAVYVTGQVRFTANGNRVLNSRYGIRSIQKGALLTVQDNSFYKNSYSVYDTNGKEWYVKGCYFQEDQNMYLRADNITFTNNTVENHQQSVHFQNFPASTTLVSENRFRNGKNGHLKLSLYQNTYTAMVERNRFDSSLRSDALLIQSSNYYYGNKKIIVSDNTFSNNIGTSIVLNSLYQANIVIERNVFKGNSYGDGAVGVRLNDLSSYLRKAPFSLYANEFVENFGKYIVLFEGRSHGSNVNRTVRSNLFLRNAVSQSVIYTNTQFLIINNNIFTNPRALYECQVGYGSSYAIDASDNWWGSINETVIESKIRHNTDSTSIGKVIFTPFLTEPEISCKNVANCSGKGLCIRPDVCDCISGWQGRNCSEYSCSGVQNCLERGTCVGPNTCKCNTGWLEPACVYASCFTKANCSDHGVCIGPDSCRCYRQYTGENCSSCADGYWGVTGSECRACPHCVNGKCNQITGKCDCFSSNWVGSLCNTCGERRYGPRCLPLMKVLRLAPNSGPDIGGTVVRVYGHNFVNASSYRCRFGGVVVSGTWVSEEEVLCTSPRQKAAQIEVNISPSQDKPFTSDEVTFTYNELCPASACGSRFTPPRGLCSFGSCLCSQRWTGADCDVIGVAPRVGYVGNLRTREGTLFTLQLAISEGTGPIDWSLSTKPPGMTIDKHTGLISWTSVASTKSYDVEVEASNVFGVGRAKFKLQVPPSYTVTLDPVPAGPYLSARPVLFSGRIVYNEVNVTSPGPMAVHIIIRTGNVLRTLRTSTVGSSGYFYLRFYPGSREVGLFEVDVRHPAISVFNPKARWTVYGMSMSPSSFYIKEYLGSHQFTKVFTVKNTGVDDLKNIKLQMPATLPFEITVRQTRDSDRACLPGSECLLTRTLGAGENISLDISITALTAVRGSFSMSVSSEEGKRLSSSVTFEFPQKLPKFDLSRGSISGTVTRGETKYFQVNVTNVGLRPASNVIAEIPSMASMAVVSFGKAGETDAGELVLDPQEKAKLVLSVHPAVDDQLGAVDGNIAIKSRETQTSLRFRFIVSSSTTVNLTVAVEDEFTYFSDARPLLSGATVKLTSSFERKTITLVTGNGSVTFENIQEGYYELRSSADKHIGDSRVLLATPGMRPIGVFLQRTAVRYSWSVTPVTFEDRYEVTLEADFETEVPMPVVTISPKTLDMEVLQRGLIPVINFEMTNHGLIRAEDVQFTLPVDNAHPFMRFEMGIENIGSIEAKTTVIVPVKVIIQEDQKAAHIDRHGPLRRKRSARSLACIALRLYAAYTYYCDKKRYQQVGVHIKNALSAFCSGQGGPGGGGGGYRGTPYWSGYSNTDITPGSRRGNVPVTSSVTCEQILECLKNAYDCYKNRKDILKKGVKCISSIRTIGVPILGPLYTFFRCYQFYKAIKPCLDTFKSCDFSSGSSRSSRAALLATKQDIAPELASRIVSVSKYFDIAEVSVDDLTWSEVNGETWLESSILPYMSDSSDGGKIITEAEYSQIKAFPLPGNATDAMLHHLVQRLNNTMSNWDKGILTGPNMINYNQYKSLENDIKKADEKSKKGGFANVFDWYEDAEDKFEKAPEKKDKGVCAKVRIRLQQRLALTREAFSARLELENGESHRLEMISVEIHIRRREDQLESKQKFAIGKPKVEGISGVDGTGTLEVKQEGSAEWLIVPYSSAAPTEDTMYDIGGTLYYTVNGQNLTVPLFPDAITVKPDPRLHLNYFLKKYIEADDPFTTVKERSVPFSLGILITNNGYGAAKKLKITSAQPEIIENEKGLLVDFKIIGTQLGAGFVSPSLTVTFGDIQPKTTAVARWIMTSSLQGKFSNYSATFENINPLGDPQLSVMESVDFHELLHVVRVDTPSDDGLPDFLTVNTEAFQGFPCCIYRSDDGLNPLRVWPHNGTTIQYLNNYDVKVSIPAHNVGWNYYRVMYRDIGDDVTLHQTKRGDGKNLLVDFNVWVDKIENVTYLHILDYFTEGNEITVAASMTTASVPSTHTYDVTFAQANNFRPVFENRTYYINVSESAAVGEGVVEVKADDADAGQSVTYMMASSDTFSLNASTGEISLMKALDRESTDTYTLTVLAVDDGMPSKTGAAIIDVTVTDVNDNSPEFQLDELDIQVESNAPVGFVIKKLSVSDKDIGQNGRVSFYLNTTDSIPFSVNSANGSLTVSSSLSSQSSVYEFAVVCTDFGEPPKRSHLPVKVTVQSQNSFTPTFNKVLYEVTVREDISPNITVFRVSAEDTDPGEAGEVTYRLLAPENSPFMVNSTSGFIKTVRYIDREERDQYVFQILAFDNGAPPTGARTGTASIQIQIQDINDNSPVFSKSSYKWEIAENTKPETVGFSVCATDKDIGPNGNVTYSLDFTGSNDNADALLYVQEKDRCAYLRLKAYLDRELKDRYELLIRAEDKGVPSLTSSVKVKVEVKDVNDNMPHFPSSPVAINLSKYTPVNNVIYKVTALDLDINDKIVYTMESSSDARFVINKDTGDIRLKRSLESTSESTISLYVQASDGLYATTKQINITITSENRIAPTFRNPGYSKSVTETMASGQTILTVQADDADSPDVSYVITGGNVGNVFHMNEATGDLTLLGSLDYETLASYELVVQAVDSGVNGENKLTSSVTVSVQVTDVNELPPVFIMNNTDVSVPENIRHNPPSAIYTVIAVNPPEQHNMKYNIDATTLTSPFSVNRATGEIRVISELDRENIDKYLLTVTATDTGVPPLTATVTITVHLVDVNDNDPVIRATPDSISISQTNLSSSLTLLQISAQDADSAENGEVHFSLLNNFTLFEIDSQTGILKCLNACKEMTQSASYDVVVIVSDKGIPPRSTRRHITVFVNADDTSEMTTESFSSYPIETSPSTVETPKETTHSSTAMDLTLQTTHMSPATASTRDAQTEASIETTGTESETSMPTTTTTTTTITTTLSSSTTQFVSSTTRESTDYVTTKVSEATTTKTPSTVSQTITTEVLTTTTSIPETSTTEPVSTTETDSTTPEMTSSTAMPTSSTKSVSTSVSTSAPTSPPTTNQVTTIQVDPVSNEHVVRGAFNVIRQFQQAFNDMNNPFTREFVLPILQLLESILQVLENYVRVHIFGLKPGSVVVLYEIEFKKPVSNKNVVAETIKAEVEANDNSFANMQVDPTSIRILPTPCTTLVCQNGGTCESPDNITSVCRCVEGFEGSSCERIQTEGVSLPLLIGLCVGLLLLIIIISVLASLLCKRRKRIL